ncbi:MAG: tRNA dihydrouridine synthase DusB [Candidatus Gastranaerophilales bacterium]|nr:tRNA dihydrouridine synthase DusB [Candidatus Gastranaerophilales bacterium]
MGNKSNFKPLKIGNLKLNTNVMLAPMAGITDTVLRQIVRKYAKTALLATEMISSEALKISGKHSICDYEEAEKPLIFQISGHKPDLMAESAVKLEKKADIIDINMGCPVGKIVKNFDGSKLMTDLKLASSIIEAVKNSVKKPVSIKCRLGWDCNTKNYIEFAKMAEDAGADALIVHGRTRSQMYSGQADWQAIGEIKNIIKIPVIANGDIDSPQKAEQCLEITNCDGIAVGRAVLGNPFIINQIEHYLKTEEILAEQTLKEKLADALLHCQMEMNYKGKIQGIKFMRKFFVQYIKGIRGACHYREKLVKVDSLNELKNIFDEIICNV